MRLSKRDIRAARVALRRDRFGAGHRTVCYLDLGGDVDSDPNIGKAAQENAEVAREALEFSKEQYADNKPRVEAYDDLVKQIVGDSLAISEENRQRAGEQWNQYQSMYAPIEQQQVYDSLGVDYMSDADYGKLSGQFSDAQSHALQSQYEKDLAALDERRRLGIATQVKEDGSIKDAKDAADRAEDAAVSANEESHAEMVLRIAQEEAKTNPNIARALKLYGGDIETEHGSFVNDLDKLAATLEQHDIKLEPKYTPTPKAKGIDTKTLKGGGTGQTSSKAAKTGNAAEEEYLAAKAALDKKYGTDLKGIEQKISLGDTIRKSGRLAQEGAAGEAAADVTSAFDASEQNARRQQFSYGFGPGDGRFRGAQRGTNLARAASSAGAMNNARRAQRAEGIALRSGVASFGRNMPNTAGQTYGIAMQGNAQAAGTQASGINAANAGAAPMYQGFNTAIAGNNSSAGILQSQYATNANLSGQQAQGMGQLVGTAAGIGMAAL